MFSGVVLDRARTDADPLEQKVGFIRSLGRQEFEIIVIVKNLDACTPIWPFDPYLKYRGYRLFHAVDLERVVRQQFLEFEMEAIVELVDYAVLLEGPRQDEGDKTADAGTMIENLIARLAFLPNGGFPIAP